MPRLREILALILLVAGATTLHAQAEMRVAPSGRATTEVTLTYADSAMRANSEPGVIRIDYGQPHLRGRRLHTDSLVPYDQPWRTGANAATTLRTDVDLEIGGKAIPKGTYILQTLPSRSGWKLLIQRDAGQSPMSSDPSNEIARIDLRQTTLPIPIESLSVWLIPSRAPGAPHGELRLAWGTTQVSTDWRIR